MLQKSMETHLDTDRGEMTLVQLIHRAQEPSVNGLPDTRHLHWGAPDMVDLATDPSSSTAWFRESSPTAPTW